MGIESEKLKSNNLAEQWSSTETAELRRTDSWSIEVTDDVEFDSFVHH